MGPSLLNCSVCEQVSRSSAAWGPLTRVISAFFVNIFKFTKISEGVVWLIRAIGRDGRGCSYYGRNSKKFL